MGLIKPTVLQGHSRAIEAVRYNTDGDLLFSASRDGHPVLWYSRNGEQVGSYEGHEGAVQSLDPSHCSRYLATADKGGFWHLYDVETGTRLISVMSPSHQPVRDVALSHGNRMISVVLDKAFGCPPAVCVYQLDAGSKTAAERPIITQSEIAEITCARWGACNDQLYYACGTSDAGMISLYDLRRNEVFTRNDSAHQGHIREFTLCRDYTFIATAGSDSQGCLLDSKTLNLVKTYKTAYPLNAVAVSPLKPHIVLGGGIAARDVTVSGGQKFRTHFYHMVYEEELGSMKGHFGPVNSVAVHPKGTQFTTGGEDGLIRMHEFPSDYYDLNDEMSEEDIRRA